jgi:lipoprotein NlpD
MFYVPVRIIYNISILLVMFLLVGCGGREDLAPVNELHWRSIEKNAAHHVVRKGETLYAIAFRYDQDYRQLAQINHLSSPYILRVGQVVQLGRASYPKPTYYAQPRPHLNRSAINRPIYTQSKVGSRQWQWPAQGRVVETFVPQQGKKGINIAGKPGAKIYAANNGIVAYAGSGLAGYGNLIIIKHDNQLLTAYGHNARNLVVEGQAIKAGQPIAVMGVIDQQYVGVHFEIRQAGRPVNPLNYLQ